MPRLTRPRDESGQALIMALVFTSLFGLFIAVLLEQGLVNVKTATAVQSRANKVLAADGGVEYGVWRARNTIAPAAHGDTVCPTVSAGAQTLTASLPLNNKQATVTCRALAGEAATAGGWPAPAAEQWAVITTSPLAGSLTTTGAGLPIKITGGDVYAGGALTLARELSVSQGDVVQQSASCTGLIPPALLTPIPAPDVWSCAAGGTPPDVPHVLPSPAPAGHDPATTVTCGGNLWKILHPGKYTSLSGLDLGANNYLESGVYYLEDYAPSFTNLVIVGGSPQPPETSVLGGGCPTDTTAGPASRATGKGVILILGGLSSITVSGVPFPGSTPASFELFTRVPAAGDTSTPGISMMGVPTSGGGYKALAPGPILTVPTASPAVAVHGLVYAPQNTVTVVAKCSAPLLGGVVASRLSLSGSTCATGPVAVRARGRRTLVLTSTAATPAASGEIAITEQAVVKVANDPARTATVRSWRAL